jgi:hypothetical protein
VKKVILTALALAALLPLTSALAQSSPTPNQPTGLTKVVSITNWPELTSNGSSEAVNVQTSQITPTNPANCVNAKPYILPETSDISKAMLLTAATSNADVQFVIYGEGCVNDYPQIIAVAIFNQQ